MTEQFPPTPEQSLILTDVTGTSRNLIVHALAGAAKTSTLVRIANALPSTAMLCLAFNKRIATEMQERLPSTCVALTLNSLGHRAWGKFLGKKFLKLDERKTFRIVREVIDTYIDPEDKKFLYGSMSDIMKAVDGGKTCGWIPDGHYPHAKPLMDNGEFFAWLDEEPEDIIKEVLIDATLRSLKEAYDGSIDFGDQLLCPTVFPATFVQYPITLVDEAQDLSALNHVMLGKVVGKKRIIAVGDECQSIYGFRGAHEDSMSLLAKTFDMKPFVLSISFRCPVKVVEEARWRAPHMQYPEWAKPGEVLHLKEWDKSTVPDFGVILCRNNAPLFNAAIKLLKNGRYPELVGNDLGKSLLKTLKSFGDSEIPREKALDALTIWKTAKLAKARNPDRVRDQAACLEIFLRQGKTLGEAILYAQTILNAAGPIKLMTGHKSKGLEFDHVYILDQDLIRDDPQDKNLRYVMQTRAKETLTYITGEGFDDEAAEEETTDE
jgi:superfamily I DNA/RNA helicase